MNLEEALIYMEELDRHEASDSDLDENVVCADIICLPPRDGDDTDKDDAASDEDVQTNNPTFLGKGVLAMPHEIELHRADGDVIQAFTDQGTSGKNKRICLSTYMLEISQ